MTDLKLKAVLTTETRRARRKTQEKNIELGFTACARVNWVQPHAPVWMSQLPFSVVSVVQDFEVVSP